MIDVVSLLKFLGRIGNLDIDQQLDYFVQLAAELTAEVKRRKAASRQLSYKPKPSSQKEEDKESVYLFILRRLRANKEPGLSKCMYPL